MTIYFPYRSLRLSSPGTCFPSPLSKRSDVCVRRQSLIIYDKRTYDITGLSYFKSVSAKSEFLLSYVGAWPLTPVHTKSRTFSSVDWQKTNTISCGANFIFSILYVVPPYLKAIHDLVTMGEHSQSRYFCGAYEDFIFVAGL